MHVLQSWEVGFAAVLPLWFIPEGEDPYKKHLEVQSLFCGVRWESTAGRCGGSTVRDHFLKGGTQMLQE